MPNTPCGHCPDHIELATDMAVVKSTVLRLEKMAVDRQKQDIDDAVDIAILQREAKTEGGKAGRRNGTVVAAAVTGSIMGIGKLISWLWGA